METKPTYIVVGPKREIHVFDSAEAVKIFMWGKMLSQWSIYKRVDDLPLDCEALKKVLELT